MLTSSGRLAVRRVIHSIPSTLPSSTLRAFAPRVIVSRSSLPARRSFTISVCLRHPAAKSALTKRTKSTSKKTKTKAKPKAKKAVKPKKKVVKKPKVLTPEQKGANKLKGLKKMALLDAPGHSNRSAWIVYLGEKISNREGSFADKMAEAKASYANMSESEKQQLSRQAVEKADNESKALAEYVASHPPEVILMANRARARLNKITTSKHKPLPDSRIPARPANGFARYVKEQLTNAPGDGLINRMRQIASQYKNLRDAEKEKYEGPAKADAKRVTEQTKELTEKGAKYWSNEGISAKAVLGYGVIIRTPPAA